MEDERRYKIGEVSSFLDISIETLRYYEKMGIVEPHKDPNSNYRYYTAWDTNYLLDCKRLRALGFSLKDINEITQKDSLRGVCAKYLRREQELMEQISAQQKLLHQIAMEHRRLQQLREEAEFGTVAQSPDLVFQCQRIREEFGFVDTDGVRHAMNPAFLDWSRIMPEPVPTVTLSFASLRSGPVEEAEYCWGYSLEPEQLVAAGLKIAPYNEIIPSRRCYHTVLVTHEKGSFLPEFHEKVLVSMEEKGFILDGSPVGRLLLRCNEEEGFTRYIEMWVPIR